MSDERRRFASKRLPGNIYRVVDRKHNRVDGIWNPNDRTWLDVSGWLYE